MHKLYLVTHKELSIGFQAAQLTHATADFAYQYSQEFKQWREQCNYVVCLETENKQQLEQLEQKAVQEGFEIVTVREPDIDNEITAILFIPSSKNRAFLSNLPCLGKKDKRQESITNLKNEIKIRNFTQLGKI